MADQPTITLRGKAYGVVRKLGDTACCRSFLVEADGRRHVLKVYRAPLAIAFDREAARLAKVRPVPSSLILPEDTGPSGEERYLLRPWIEAVAFDDFTRGFTFVPRKIEPALAMPQALCRAVAPLHAAGLGHGRLTNNNVFFGADGAPVVTDALIGTTGAAPTPAGDVAQLGLLLCRIFARRPELTLNDRTLMELHKAKVPLSLIRVLWHAIQPRPEDRFADAAMLATALAEVTAAEHLRTVYVRPTPLAAAPAMGEGVSPGVRNAALLVLALGMVAMGAWWWGTRRAPDSTEVKPATSILAAVTAPKPTPEVDVAGVGGNNEGDSSPPPLLAALPWGLVDIQMPPSPVVIVDDTPGEPNFRTEGRWRSTFVDAEAVGGHFTANVANTQQEDLGGKAIWSWHNAINTPQIIHAHHKGSSYRASSISYSIQAGQKHNNFVRSQRLDSVRWEWLNLGTYDLPAGLISLSIDTWEPKGGGRVVADAIQIQPLVTDRIDTSFLPPHFLFRGTWIKEGSTWTTSARAAGEAMFSFPGAATVSGVLYAFFQPSTNGSRDAVYHIAQGKSERVIHTNQRIADNGQSYGLVRLGEVDLGNGDLTVTFSSQDASPDVVHCITGMCIIQGSGIVAMTMSSDGLEKSNGWNRGISSDQEYWAVAGAKEWVSWTIDIPEDGLYEVDTTTRTGTNRTTAAVFSIIQAEKTTEVLIDQRSDSGSQIRQASLGVFHLKEGRVVVKLDASRSAQDGVVIAQSIMLTRLQLPQEASRRGNEDNGGS